MLPNHSKKNKFESLVLEIWNALLLLFEWGFWICYVLMMMMIRNP